MKNTEFILLYNPQDNIEINVEAGKQKAAVLFFDEETGEREIHVTMRPGRESKLYVAAVCALSNTTRLRLITHQVHEHEYGLSDFLCKSVLKDKSSLSYYGTIRISRAGQHAHAYQRNENLVLSSGVSVVSEPNLEILANDVFCTHGATTGYMDEVELHYLQSRGLPRARAEKLYANGFLLSVVDKLVSAGVSAAAIKKLQEKLEK